MEVKDWRPKSPHYQLCDIEQLVLPLFACFLIHKMDIIAMLSCTIKKLILNEIEYVKHKVCNTVATQETSHDHVMTKKKNIKQRNLRAESNSNSQTLAFQPRIMV